MLKKPVLGALLLASAAGGPYVLFETDAGKSATQAVTGLSQVTLDSAPPKPAETVVDPSMSPWDVLPTDSAVPMNPQVAGHNLRQPPITSIREVLRYDATPGWVIGRFPRVTTVLADTQLDGLRTPIVTGTTPTDLAGTLTYYFDPYKRLQRVSIYGVTGDPSRLVQELQSVYGMEQEPSLGGGLYMLKWNGQPKSILHVATAPVIYGDAPYARYSVFLELNQPGLEYGLSYEANQLVANGKQTKRW